MRLASQLDMPLRCSKARKAVKEHKYNAGKGFSVLIEKYAEESVDQHIVDPNIFSLNELILCECTVKKWKEILDKMKDGTATDYSDRDHNSDGSSIIQKGEGSKIIDSAKTIKQISTFFPPLEPKNEKILDSDVTGEDARSSWVKALHNLLA